MKQKLLNSMRMALVAVLLGVGANVWGEDTSGTIVSGSTITETYDFNGWGLANLNSKAEATIAKASEDSHHIIGETVFM